MSIYRTLPDSYLRLLIWNSKIYFDHVQKNQKMVRIRAPIKVKNLEDLFLVYGHAQIILSGNLTENEKEIIRCPISMDRMIMPVMLDCGHEFCDFSFSEFFSQNRTCPLCRK